MRMEEYLSTVTEQIRCQRARELVACELKDHILDQAEAYEAEGISAEEAMEKAVREMGDPIETGVSLDRIHRPRMEKGILGLIGIISILSIFLHAAFGAYSPELASGGIGYLKNHIMYTIYGYILMLMVYRLDYSILNRWAKPAAAGFLALIWVGIKVFGILYNGAVSYIRFGPFFLSVPMLLYLYAPLYAGVLYQYRGEGYKAFWKIALWSVIPSFIALKIPSVSVNAILLAVFAVLFTIAVCQNWYQVNKKKVLTVFWGGMSAIPVLILGLLYVTGNLAGYQAARLHAFLTKDANMNYQANVAAGFLSRSPLLGRNEAVITELAQLPGFNSDYVFVSVVSVYGILAGVLLVALFAFLLIKIFRISFCQKNRLGMILGCACGTVFLAQLLLCLLVNLGLFPATSTSLPFFSCGGSGIVVSYMLLGLVLSIYRYKNILSEKPETKAAEPVS